MNQWELRAKVLYLGDDGHCYDTATISKPFVRQSTVIINWRNYSLIYDGE